MNYPCESNFLCSILTISIQRFILTSVDQKSNEIVGDKDEIGESRGKPLKAFRIFVFASSDSVYMRICTADTTADSIQRMHLQASKIAAKAYAML